jgi:hypothetical protein
MRGLEAAAIDDALDLFALWMSTRLISQERRATERERLAMLPVLEKASRTLARASRVLFSELESLEQRQATLDPTAVWAAIEKVASRAAVTSALNTVEELVAQDEGSVEIALRTALGARYNTVRPFLRLLGESGALATAPGGRRILKAVRTLPALVRRRVRLCREERSDAARSRIRGIRQCNDRGNDGVSRAFPAGRCSAAGWGPLYRHRPMVGVEQPFGLGSED